MNTDMKPSLAKHLYMMTIGFENMQIGNERYIKLMNCSPIYTPNKHTTMSYRAQQRAAKKRRK